MPATRKGGKPNQRARVQSQSLQIGQLETTPTSRHLQSRRVDDKPDPPSAQQPPQASANEYEDKIDDADLMVLNDELDVPKDFWSEVASTHRSTPAPEAGRAHFDSPSSVIDDFSSLRSGSGKLPSTQPLPSQLVARPEANIYDFSETATTARRSSPVQPHNTLSQVALDRAWEYPKNNTVPELPGTIPDSYQVPELDAMKHLPENELYDATPASEEELQDAPEQPQVTMKSKPPQRAVAKRTTKGVKKAKAALEFDEKTQQVIDKSPNQSGRIMRQAHAASISPIESTNKSTPKPRKKPSPRVTTEDSPKPSRKAAAVAARRITRQSALAEELAQPSSEETKVISPTVEQAEPATKTSDVAAKKTTTQTVVETEPSKANALKRTATTRDTLVDTSAPRKTMKRSRSFSVSRAGSPLPVDATDPVEDTSPIDEEEDEPEPILPHNNKQTSGHRRSQRLRDLAD